MFLFRRTSINLADVFPLRKRCRNGDAVVNLIGLGKDANARGQSINSFRIILHSVRNLSSTSPMLDSQSRALRCKNFSVEASPESEKLSDGFCLKLDSTDFYDLRALIRSTQFGFRRGGWTLKPIFRGFFPLYFSMDVLTNIRLRTCRWLLPSSLVGWGISPFTSSFFSLRLIS